MKAFSAISGLIGALSIGWLSPLLAQDSDQPLQIYWIDVEGGSSTLIVTPQRESVLMDAGWNREDARDALRIQAAMNDAGITEIDYFIASHFHGDHVGGAPALASRVTIHRFMDHGDSVEQTSERGQPAWEAYLSAADGKRSTAVPGAKLPLSGVELSFVAANRELVPGSGSAANEHCPATAPREDLGENSRSVGYMVTLGDFQFLDLGDLTVDLQHTLACPSPRLDAVDLLQIPHHGQGVAAELVFTLAPTAAVVNNGPQKGGRAEDLAVVQQIPDVEGIWQIHRALAAAVEVNAAERMTANLTDEDDQGHWIKATVEPSGESYRITNARNDYSESYRTK